MIKKKFLNVQFLNSSQIPKQKDQAVHFYFIWPLLSFAEESVMPAQDSD